MKKFDLILSGGGAKGFAHIGVLQVLQENNLIPSKIIGVSMGAIVGAHFCYKQDAKLLQDLATALKVSDLLDINFLFPFSNHFLNDKKLNKYFDEIWADITIEQLSIPFECLAVDLYSGKEVLLKEGGLTEAVRASSNLGVIWEPIMKDGLALIDGGAINNLPIEYAESDHVKIAVDVLNAKTISDDVPKTKTALFFEIYTMQVIAMSKARYDLANLMLVPDTSLYKFMTVKDEDIMGLVNEGRKIAEENLEAIKKLLGVK